jgi:PAS domain S-box-containing protein
MAERRRRGDDTDQERTEQTVREDEARLSAILAQVPGAVGLFSSEGRSLFRSGPLGHLWDEMIPSRAASSSRRWRSFDNNGRLLAKSDYPGERALRGEMVVPGIDFLHAADAGGESWFRVSAAPFRNKSGEIVGAVMILQNIDTEKRVEQRLRESESRLKAAVDLVNLGLYSWDPQTNELDWDKAVKAMWGLREDAPVTYDMWRDAVHPDDLQRVEAAIAGSIDPRNGSYDVEYRVTGQTDGLERWIATRGRTEFENGKPVSFHGVALDVTDRKRTENTLERRVDVRTRELEEANAALISEIEQRRQIAERLDAIQAEFFHAARLSVAGQMAAVLAHELSQPLTATLNSVNTLRRLLASSDLGRDMALRELIEEAASETERAGEIVRRLRFFIRRGSVDRTPEAIAPMVEEAVAFAAVGPNALGVTISQYFDPLVPTALVDRVQIQQVISNLVRNALEALKIQSRRELSVASAACGEGYMEVIVSDNGPGVADEMRPNLFEPFNTNKPDGMGLGLSICKSIVEAHGGRIAYAPSLDGGSAFRFTLECAPEDRLQ